jgi:eukaryotic-like serine/threonine-protein kinase
MGLLAGTQLGPYEIVSLVGVGGMGEVYRARDPRLRRDVAIKLLPPSFSSSPDRLQRFEQEAHAAAALNHPNILAVYDIGRQDNSPYIVSELLQGETLREQLQSGALSQRKAIDYATQIAHGLAAAHDKGIIHRDLKPENIFITQDGRAKILDFGLAKLKQPESGDDTQTLTGVMSEAGTVLGTVGYMSPEQVRAKPVDARSDLFSFGVILYEMLSGKRAFQAESAPETMSAIVKEDPPDLSETNRNISPALERIIRHCLEKNPVARFQSAHDLAFNLEALSGTSKSVSGVDLLMVEERKHSRVLPALGAALGIILLAGAFLWGRGMRSSGKPEFHQLTYRSGTVYRARFAADGNSILYSASWEGKPTELFTAPADGVESRSLASDTLVAAVSSKNQLAVLLHPKFISAGTVCVATGTLAVMPMEGGAPRPLMQDVNWADWTPDGAELAVIRVQELPVRKTMLQFPIDKVLYTPARGWISDVRFSSDGKYLAFEEHVPQGDDGKIMVIDRDGKKVAESPHYDSVNGMAWAGSDEVWFTASFLGNNQFLQAMDMRGRTREVYRAPASMRIYDIGRNGRVLLTNDNDRLALLNGASGGAEQDLSWFNWSLATDISSDGSTVLFSESSAAANGKPLVLLRKTDRTPAVTLGGGFPWSLSPDGNWVATLDDKDPQDIVLLPTGVGRAEEIPPNGWDYGRVRWTADNKALLVTAQEHGHPPRICLLDIATKKITPLLPEGVRGGLPSPDGKFLAGAEGDTLKLYSMSGNEIRSVAKLTLDDSPDRWSADGKSLLVWNYASASPRLDRMDAVTGKRITLSEVKLLDRAGDVNVAVCHVTPDGKFHICSEHRLLTDLFVANGLR